MSCDDYGYVFTDTSTVSFTSTGFVWNDLFATYKLWDFDDGTTSTLDNPTHTFGANGIYNVKFITGDCIHSDTITKQIEIGTTLTIPESIYALITIYPNPAKDKIYLQTNAQIEIANVTIEDVTGKVMLTLKSGQEEIDISKLSFGLYLIKLKLVGVNQSIIYIIIKI